MNFIASHCFQCFLNIYARNCFSISFKTVHETHYKVHAAVVYFAKLGAWQWLRQPTVLAARHGIKEVEEDVLIKRVQVNSVNLQRE